MSSKPAKKKNAPYVPKKVLSNRLVHIPDEDMAEFLEPYRKNRLSPIVSPDKVDKPLPVNGFPPVTDSQSPAPFLSLDDLQKLTNDSGYKKAIAATSNAALLKLAWDHAQQMKEIAEEAIKHRLWGDDAPEGQLRFNVFEKNGILYINAHIGNSTRSVPREDIKALESLLQTPTQQETFLGREAVRATSKVRSLP